MPEFDRLSVVLETDLSRYSAGMKKAGKEAQGLASEIQKAKKEADKGGEFKLKPTQRQLNVMNGSLMSY